MFSVLSSLPPPPHTHTHHPYPTSMLVCFVLCHYHHCIIKHSHSYSHGKYLAFEYYYIIIVIMYISGFLIGFYPLTFLTPRQQELQRTKPKSYLGKSTFWSTMQVTLLQLSSMCIILRVTKWRPHNIMHYSQS